jgi:hypothetical protein
MALMSAHITLDKGEVVSIWSWLLAEQVARGPTSSRTIAVV